MSGVRPDSGSGLRFIIAPESDDIVWAAAHDVYSGTVQKEQSFILPKYEQLSIGRSGFGVGPNNEVQYSVTVTAIPSDPRVRAVIEGPAGGEYRWTGRGSISGKEVTRSLRKLPDAYSKDGFTFEAMFGGSTVYFNSPLAADDLQTMLKTLGLDYTTAVRWDKDGQQISEQQYREAYEAEREEQIKASRNVRVDPKAPSARNLSQVADSVAAAVDGRQPDHYNELALELLYGDFYIEETQVAAPATSTRFEAREEEPGYWQVWDTQESKWATFGTIKHDETWAREYALNANGRRESSIPSELQPLNELLKAAYIKTHGSLDPMPKAKAEAPTDTPSYAEHVLRGVNAEKNRPLLEIAQVAHESNPSASLSTSLVLEYHIDDLFRTGVAYQHKTLMEGKMKLMEVLKEAEQFLTRHVQRFGLGPDHAIQAYDDGKIPLRRWKTKRHVWSVPERDMLAQWNEALKSIVMDRAVSAQVANMPAETKDQQDAMIKKLRGISKETIRNVRIEWGHDITDPFTGETVTDAKGKPTHTETVGHFLDRWNNPRNTVKPVMAEFRPSMSRIMDFSKGDPTYNPYWATEFTEHRHLKDKWFKLLPGAKYFQGHVTLEYDPAGFMDSRTRAVRDEISRYIRDIDMPDGAETLLGEEEYRWDFTKTHREPPQPTGKQIRVLKDLMARNSNDGTISKEDFDVETKGWSGWDFNAAIKKELTRAIHDQAAREVTLKDDEWKVKITPNDEFDKMVRTLKKLTKTLDNYRFPEWTSREMSRRLFIGEDRVQTFAEAFQASKGRFRPRGGSLAEETFRYAQSIAAAGLNKMMLNKMLLTTDYDGAPLVLMEPSELTISTRTKVAEIDDGAIDVKNIIADETWRQYGEILYQHLKRRKESQKDLKYSPDLDIRKVREQVRKMVNLAANASEYKEHKESPYASVSKIWGARGEPDQILSQLVGAPYRWMVGDYDVLKGLYRFAQWSKIGAVSWSIFFPLSLIESLIAGTGMARNILYHPVKHFREITEIMRNMKTPQNLVHLPGTKQHHNPLTVDLAANGVELGSENVTDQAIGVVGKDSEWLVERFRLRYGDKAAERFGAALNIVSGQFMSKFFFGRMFPAMKIWAADRYLSQEAKRRYNIEYASLSSRQRSTLLRDVAPIINDAYGGQFWHRYTWATPGMLQVLNLSLFAPNWSLSAWNVAGGGMLSGGLLQNYMSQANKQFVFMQNWPAMYVLAMVGFPLLFQAGIYALGSIGGGDPDDRPFPWQNEPGRADSVLGLPYNWYVDTTPLMRLMPGYEGAPTGQRRTYVRGGKQAYEVLDGWLAEPGAQLMRKLSQPAKLVLEELTGKSPGSDWNLEFAGKGWLGWFMVDREGVDAFLGSRVGYVVQKVLPMSALGGIKNPDSWAAGFFAPASKGTSQATAIEKLTEILQTYGDTTAWAQVSKSPAATETLASLAPALLDALQRNGYDPDKALNSAKGIVLGRYYTKIWEALQAENYARVNELAMSVLRVGGSLDGLQRSVTQKARQYRREVAPEMREAMAMAFRQPAPEQKVLKRVPKP